MLNAEMNERLTGTGPGTPCAGLTCRHRIPAAPYAQHRRIAEKGAAHQRSHEPTPPASLATAAWTALISA